MGIPIKLFPLNNVGICSVAPSSARILRPEGELATSYTVLTHQIIPVPMSEMVEPQPEGEMNQATTITTGRLCQSDGEINFQTSFLMEKVSNANSADQ